MATYRERREARADRLQDWADGREAKAEAAHTRADTLASAIPFGQPILAGHHSEGRDRNYRARIAATYDRAAEHAAKAESMRSRAANIRAAADRAIYTDDPDAAERLARKLAGLEAERDRIKAYNVTARRGAPDPGLLDAAQRAQLASVAKHAPYQLGKGGALPSYALSNLAGRIAETRRRLSALGG